MVSSARSVLVDQVKRRNMKKSRANIIVSLLVFLLLGNNSLALEVMVHDAHIHGALLSVDENPMLDVLHDRNIASSSTDIFESSVGEDCICDEICCLGTIDVTLPDVEKTPPFSVEKSTFRKNYYQSISLDLLLPPPTT